jgi:hypothetical protein
LINLDPQVRQVAEFLTGKFDNSTQSATDPAFIPVTYNNCQVEIVNSVFPVDSISVFAEQIGTTPQISFARRRLMQVRLYSDRQLVEVAFYHLNEDDRFADLGEQSRELYKLKAEDIGEYECSLFFTGENGIYVGGTPEGGCPHHYQGAETLIIQGNLSSEKLAIWERWYDKNGNQVAGPVKGPYIYCPIPKIG